MYRSADNRCAWGVKKSFTSFRLHEQGSPCSDSAELSRRCCLVSVCMRVKQVNRLWARSGLRFLCWAFLLPAGFSQSHPFWMRGCLHLSLLRDLSHNVVELPVQIVCDEGWIWKQTLLIPPSPLRQKELAAGLLFHPDCNSISALRHPHPPHPAFNWISRWSGAGGDGTVSLSRFFCDTSIIYGVYVSHMYMIINGLMPWCRRPPH